MVRIRLRRVGAKRQPSYRIVVAHSESPRDGRFIEMIGHYNPRTDPPTIEMKEDRVLYWLSVGAQPSDPVRRMIEKRGLFERLATYRASGSVITERPPAAKEAEAPAQVEEPKAKKAKTSAQAEVPATPEMAAESEASESGGMAEQAAPSPGAAAAQGEAPENAADDAVAPIAEEVSS